MTTIAQHATEPSIAARIADFADCLSYEALPGPVRERAKHLILDGIGVALASSTFDFAQRAYAAVVGLAAGERGRASVIGFDGTVPTRDAVLCNGILVHGLDYDDTHPAGVVHASASAFPTALGVAEERGLPGAQLLTAYVAGVEVAARLGMAARGAFHQFGFHPTGLVGAFGAAVTAACLRDLPASAIAQAQGFVGSQAAGSLEFLETGAWTKRVHPGWAGVCGITAAAFAAQGFESPDRIYEGRFGFYASHLGDRAAVDLAACTKGLSEEWETLRVAVKPFPACHFTHAFADAMLALAQQHDLSPGEIARIRCRIAPEEMGTVCEPEENKRRPQSDYDARFSLAYVVAATLARGRFTLAELDAEALTDPQILGLAARVTYEPDPDSGFPDLFSGEVVVETVDGRTLSHREQVNRGADTRPLAPEEIRAKFLENAGLAFGSARAEQALDTVLALDDCDDVRKLTRLLRR